MTKRYREAIDEVEVTPHGEPGSGRPRRFRWRGRRYRVLQVLGHWREEQGWWRRADGRSVQIEQADRWRVEARNGTGDGGHPVSERGVYELVCRGGRWRLDRVWD